MMNKRDSGEKKEVIFNSYTKTTKLSLVHKASYNLAFYVRWVLRAWGGVKIHFFLLSSFSIREASKEKRSRLKVVFESYDFSY